MEFEAKKGQRIRMEVIAARMGSPVDAVLTLTKADAPSTVIQEVDDDAETVSGKRFDTRGIDPALSWVAPEEGRYRIMIRDVAGSRRGLGLFYRLTLEEEAPDFRAFILSSAPQNPQALTLLRGGADYYEAHVLRRGGYEGTILVEATGLPPGVSCPPVMLGPRASFAPLVFSAEPGAPIEATEARVLVCGWSSGERSDRPGLAYVMDRAASDDNTVPNLVRKIHGLPLAVIEDVAPFRLTATPERLAMRPGEKQPVKLKAVPKSGSPIEGEVALSFLGSVPGLKAPGGKIEKGKDEASIELQLEAAAVPGRYSIAFLGEAEVQFSRKPEEKKQKVKVRYPTPALTLDVVAPPFEIRVADLHGGKLQPGGSLSIDVAVQKRHGFEGPLVLALVPPEAVKDLKADEVRLPTGATGGTIAVKALAGGANPGPRPDLILRATADLFGIQVSADVKLALEVEAKK
jgi:hypothetical protein